MQKYWNTVTDRSGKAIQGASIAVTTYPAGSAATLYSDDGVTPIANPLTTDANGYFEFYAADGRYSITVAGDGITPYTINDVALMEDPSDDKAAIAALQTSVAGHTADIAARLPEIGTYALLRAYTGPLTAFYVRGVASLFDGGAGVFRVDASDTTSADNGGTILVDASGRRWKREIADAIFPQWFSATPGGSVDASSGLNLAATYAASAGIALALQGRTWLCRGVNFPAGLKVISGGAVLKGAHSPASAGAVTHIAKIIGNDVVIEGTLTIDGSKSAYSAQPDGDHYDFYSVSTSGHRIDDLRCINGVRNGFFFDGVSDFTIGRHEVKGAYRTGALFYACSDFEVGYYEYRENGYGFGKTKSNRADVSHDFLGWGCVASYICHDFSFVDGVTGDNGRDGLGAGNGSYRYRVRGVAEFNGDGGYSLFADNNGTGRPGENTAPFDGDYDCIAYGNRSSGLAAYTAIDRLKVRGRYYNNNAIAGQRTTAASALAGVFVASSSTNVDVDVTAEDRRQTATVTGTGSSPTFNVDAWATGDLTTYPYVGVWTSTGTFRGYAKVTAETAASVTLETAPNDGVTLANIVVGDFISLATQEYGVYLGNVWEGQAKTRGESSNRKAFTPVRTPTTSGGPYNGRGRVLSLDTVGTNSVANSSFSADVPPAAPANWSASLGGGSWQTVNAGALRGKNALEITSAAGSAYAQISTVTAGDITDGFLKRTYGQFCEFSALTYVTEANAALLRVLVETSAGVFMEYEAYAKKVGWNNVVVLAPVNDGAVAIRARLQVAAGAKTARFNEVNLVAKAPQ